MRVGESLLSLDKLCRPTGALWGGRVRKRPTAADATSRLRCYLYNWIVLSTNLANRWLFYLHTSLHLVWNPNFLLYIFPYTSQIKYISIFDTNIFRVRLYQLQREDTQARESDITLRHEINVVGLWVYGRERTQFEMASRSLARWRHPQTRVKCAVFICTSPAFHFPPNSMKKNKMLTTVWIINFYPFSLKMYR